VKLESSLRFRPGLLLMVPLVDVFGILLVFFLLGSSLVLQSGVRVELPPSSFALQGLAEGHVLVVSAGDSAKLLLDDGEQSIDGVGERLDALARADRERLGRVGSVVIKADRTTPHGLVMALADAALARGFRVAVAAQPREED
jgi:biopolymer transport protein ExbD